MKDLFSPVIVKSLTRNIFSLLDDEWMLITAGDIKYFNTMTASWGGFGILWNKPVAFIFIRPQRYTLGFVDNRDYFTLSFFNEQFRDILNFCGSRSGKEVDKIAETGLKPVETDNGGVFFEQASLMMECRKLYTDNIKPENFSTNEIDKKIYKNKDYHYMFVAEITKCLKRN